ncbi:glycosyltransferase [Marinobacter salsuginis]|uniref:glycosyltransferase n=1 Tax=Marinobacter salsuginis TaxID=418719 RepID=UPI001C94C90B|nr:glycosyltransferase [Marinobacter salsuginis]MBY6070309.1 glycosyltransferase [Marinobacter salsuginis]
MNNRPFCSVIIPAFNEEQNIEECLLSLVNQSYPREFYEIIVVDNGSSDRTPQMASAYADLVLEKPDGNVGAVRNHGIADASGEVIICTDADCVVPPDWIEKGVTLLKDNPHHAFGGGLRSREGAGWVEKYWTLNESGKSTQQRSLMGSSIFMWKKDFAQVGGFNEVITSGEDTDLSERAVANSVAVTVSAELSVAHLGCADTIGDFIRRQIWHSENYILDLKNSLKDRVFWLTLIYLGCLTTALVTFFEANILATSITLAFAQVPSGILSIKRITRSAWQVNSIGEMSKIMALDNFYLIGRSIGLLKGALKTTSRLRSRLDR